MQRERERKVQAENGRDDADGARGKSPSRGSGHGGVGPKLKQVGRRRRSTREVPVETEGPAHGGVGPKLKQVDEEKLYDETDLDIILYGVI